MFFAHVTLTGAVIKIPNNLRSSELPFCSRLFAFQPL